MLCFTACDTVKEDPDVLLPETAINGKEIYLSGNSASIIDINWRVVTNLPVTLSVTQPTTKGKLTELGVGLLRYAPNDRNASTRDAFEFTVYSESHEILRKDTVVIIVEPDSTKLPCGLYPKDDYVSNYKGGSPLTIDVLANDNLCGVDSLDLLLNVYYQENTNSGPHHGTAAVVNNKILYTPGPSYTTGDTLIYRVQSRLSRTDVGFGYVYIGASTISPPCTFTLRADTIQINPDTLQADTVLLRVFNNDILCDSLFGYQLSIAKAPLYGQARLGWEGVTYTPDELPAGTSRTDSLRYQLCRDAVCRQAKVVVKLSR